MIRNVVLYGDALARLRELPDECVSMCCTSPPYYQLRDYEAEGQLGREETPEEYVSKLVEVFHEVRRVLHSTGVLMLNLGDKYATKTATTKTASSISTTDAARSEPGTTHARRRKGLVGIP
jgi:DNA modification methylase